MNKRIKKKKAKQAELRRQQELEELLQNPETIRQGLLGIGIAFSNVFEALSIAFGNLAKSAKSWAEQFDEEKR
ncbi:hypothetical protein [Streptococcus suis]|uniref:hypothetical protein n=1 Tax=Streptococcus suis TaxID=1307 RepID=UPI00040BE938|nr:hypothetical protein [Streptococcus suis]MCK3990853.1 hypothetical protein [Streptococcus suis]MDE1695553.1 hypothetical protein [Streptococcus suis]NQL58544.1 hypothetical protein [Streptococcus suis]NQL92800.1 hypothetical protein [Streptococcus suis]NQM09455.1 hypothetical protein [Streptococcus suis]